MVKPSLFALALGLLMAGEARAGLTFSASPCGGAGEAPCTVTQAYQPAVNAAPLSQQSFNEFYAWDTHGQPAIFSNQEIGSNADYAFGYVYNNVDGLFHTMYVNGPNGLICCTIDEPWQIIGINANNMAIGTDGTFPFISFIDGAETVALLPAEVRVLGQPDNFPLGADYFLAIDDGNNILARSYETGGLYELHPVADSGNETNSASVPEAGSIWLLATGLISVLFIRRRGRRVTSGELL